MLDHLERVPQFVRDEREQLIVASLIFVGRHDDPQVPVAVRGRDIRQETSVQMTECTVSKLDVNDAVRSPDRVHERAEGCRPLGPFAYQSEYPGIGRPDAGQVSGGPRRLGRRRGHDDGAQDGDSSGPGVFALVVARAIGVNHDAQDGEQRLRCAVPPAPNLCVRALGVFGTVGEFSGDFLGPLKRVSFEPFTLEAETRLLLRGPHQQPVHLSPKAYELLCVLVETRPRAIAKSELHERLWPSTFVSEATLASLVAELREALGERGRKARFIRTVHGFGYAFSGLARENGSPDPGRVANWIIYNGREQSLDEGDHVLGRDADVAVPLSSSTVSRHHARITITGQIAILEDLGSKNGTYLRGQAVTSPTPLVDGDQIRIGALELTFRTLAAPKSTETQR